MSGPTDECMEVNTVTALDVLVRQIAFLHLLRFLGACRPNVYFEPAFVYSGCRLFCSCTILGMDIS